MGTRRWIVMLLGAALTLSSCAYYNTYYMANKYYMRATNGLPYPVEPASGNSNQNYNRAIDYSKKLIANYPKSKWVDDAWLLWARSLLGRDDPIQTVTMLQDFDTHFPKSPIRNEATFYLGVGQRASRHNSEALVALDEFLKSAPKNSLVPYAHYERARVLLALDRPSDAADAAGVIIEKYSKSPLATRARTLRADARFAAAQYDRAREDYHYMGTHARTDDERLDLLLREADCLEAGRQFDQELALLSDAISHVPVPVHGDTSGGNFYTAPTGPRADHYGRLLLRIGSVHLIAGRLEPALTAYRRVVEDYPHTALGAEAQYRIGYAYETEGDDFPRAREAYAKVRDQGSSQAYTTQAAQRLAESRQAREVPRVERRLAVEARRGGLPAGGAYLLQLDKPGGRSTPTAGGGLAAAGTPWAGQGAERAGVGAEPQLHSRRGRRGRCCGAWSTSSPAPRPSWPRATSSRRRAAKCRPI
jgi:tetratricopeptide (TPR) repeat protein